jgi:hypothetical protein
LTAGARFRDFFPATFAFGHVGQDDGGFGIVLEAHAPWVYNRSPASAGHLNFSSLIFTSTHHNVGAICNILFN